MLEWLKTILGDHYTEDIDKQISAEIGKGFVARADFNSKNDELKTANDTIKELQKPAKKFDGQEDVYKRQAHGSTRPDAVR